MSAEPTFNQHPLVRFDKLAIGDQNEISRLENAFISNGWCFVELPNENGQLTHKLCDVSATLSNFFNEDQKTKTNYESSNAFGYSHVGHKEGIKVLINEHGLGNYHRRLTDDIEHVLEYLAAFLRHHTDIIKSIIFKMPTLANSPARESVKLSALTMLDIVQYFNQRTAPSKQPKVGFNTNEVNCVPHFDPGLFSLSILSTGEGLQLSDQLQDQWIDGPINSRPDQRHIGVIWLGEAASILTQNRFKSGIHRVVYPSGQPKPRLTIWQEVCTVGQIEPLLQSTNEEILVPKGKAIRMVNQPNSKPFPVRAGGENRNHFMKRLEQNRGISVSKSAPHHASLFDYDESDTLPKQQQPVLSQQLPGGAVITMKNQPNSTPLYVDNRGETVNDFMKRVESDRGLSMSKSGVEHLSIRVPSSKPRKESSSGKKPSFFSTLFKS